MRSNPVPRVERRERPLIVAFPEFRGRPATEGLHAVVAPVQEWKDHSVVCTRVGWRLSLVETAGGGLGNLPVSVIRPQDIQSPVGVPACESIPYEEELKAMAALDEQSPLGRLSIL